MLHAGPKSLLLFLCGEPNDPFLAWNRNYFGNVNELIEAVA